MPRRRTHTVSSLIKSMTIDVMRPVIIEMGNNPDAIIRKGRRAEYEVLIRRYHNANPDIDMHAFVDRVILAIDELDELEELEEEFDEVFCAKLKAMAILVSILSDESPLDMARLGDRFKRTNDHYSWNDSYKDLLGSFSDFLRNNHRFTVLDREKHVFSVCLAAEYDQQHNGDHCIDLTGDDSDVDVVDDDQEDDDVEPDMTNMVRWFGEHHPRVDLLTRDRVQHELESEIKVKDEPEYFASMQDAVAPQEKWHKEQSKQRRRRKDSVDECNTVEEQGFEPLESAVDYEKGRKTAAANNNKKKTSKNRKTKASSSEEVESGDSEDVDGNGDDEDDDITEKTKKEERVRDAKEKAMAILVSILSDESPLDLTRLGDRFKRMNHRYSWNDSYKHRLGSFSDFLRDNRRFTVLNEEKQVFSVCLAAEYMAGDDSDVVVADDDDDQEDDANITMELLRAHAREREYYKNGIEVISLLGDTDDDDDQEVQKKKKDDTLSDHSRSTKTTKRSSFFRKTERNNASAASGNHDAEVQTKEKDGDDGDGGKVVMHATPINYIATTTLVPLSSHSNDNDTNEQSHQPPPVKKRKLNIDTDQACEALCELPY